jgi:hypothetical protein
MSFRTGYQMTQQRVFPFRRISVDHMVRGVTRVWWQLEPLFNDPGPYTFQLQFGHTGLRDTPDWQNVGSPVVNTYTAADPAWREGGYDILSHYRVKLTTSVGVYVSQAANCYGDLTEKDWLLAREIIRKEQLRNRLVSVPGYLIKPYRYGTPCKRCRDQLTQEVTDANCEICSGTGFEIGFHPPLGLQCWDLSPEVIQEDVDNEVKGSTRENAYVTARVIGFPALNKNDIWVNGSSDERWRVETIQVVASIRGVPIVYSVKMGLVPFNNSVYSLEVGGEPEERPGPTLPVKGCGTIAVDHNYGGQENLIYAVSIDGCPIIGAAVYVFTRAVFDELETDTPRNLAVASTTTRANGRWTESLRLDPGEYAILFEKLGEYGPDVAYIEVTAPALPQMAPAAAPSPRRNIKPLNNSKDRTNGFWDI